MKKLISLALAIVMIMCLSTTAFAATVEAPGDYTADVTGSYVAGNESNGIVYCVDITWSDLDFTYHAEKGAVWDPDTLKYSEGAWRFFDSSGNAVDFFWTETGTHEFFAYNKVDYYSYEYQTDNWKVDITFDYQIIM